jgi:CelD/BcsL family acetyltransferase involved in cellulose biosynthesis
MTAAEPRAAGTRDVPLNFQIGEWRVFSVPCRLSVIECERVPASDALPPLGDAQGYLLKGLEVPFDTAQLAGRSGWFHRVLREYPRHLVDMTTTYDDYLAKFSGKTRSTLKRKLRKFQELSGGTIDWREYRTPEELGHFLPQALELSAKTYQERLLDAGLPASPAFKEKMLSRAAQGQVRAYLLFLDKKPVSYLYLPLEGDCAIYAYLGYDPAHAELSPGTVLHLLASERLFADAAVATFDFTEGAGQHKQMFATHTKQCADVVLLKATISMRALTGAHAAFTRSEAGLARLLEALGLKRRLKRLLRAFASRNA